VRPSRPAPRHPRQENPANVSTRTYTQQHADSDIASYLAILQDEGIRGADRQDAAAYAVEQSDQWPDTAACPEHPKAA
jgi:hypothetical protein